MNSVEGEREEGDDIVAGVLHCFANVLFKASAQFLADTNRLPSTKSLGKVEFAYELSSQQLI